MKSKIYPLLYIGIPAVFFGAFIIIGILGLASWGVNSSSDGLKVVETHKIEGENEVFLLEERSSYKANGTLQENPVSFSFLVFDLSNKLIPKSDMLSENDISYPYTYDEIKNYIDDSNVSEINEMENYELLYDGHEYVVREFVYKGAYYYHVAYKDSPQNLLSIFSSDEKCNIDKIIVLYNDNNVSYCQIGEYFTYIDNGLYGQAYMSFDDNYICHTNEFSTACRWMLDNAAYEKIDIKKFDAQEWFKQAKDFLDNAKTLVCVNGITGKPLSVNFAQG